MISGFLGNWLQRTVRIALRLGDSEKQAIIGFPWPDERERKRKFSVIGRLPCNRAQVPPPSCTDSVRLSHQSQTAWAFVSGFVSTRSSLMCLPQSSGVSINAGTCLKHRVSEKNIYTWDLTRLVS